MKEDDIKKLIDFTLEVTNGCQYNCTGCFVDKTGNSWPSEEEFDKLDFLIDDLNKNEFKPMNLQIGPTDIMTSFNRDKILTNNRIKNLAKKFLKTAVNCAFLDPFDENYVQLGKKLNWLLEGGIVKFVVPFEAYHIDNKEYINRIKNRIQITLDNMPDVVYTKTYLIMNYEATSIYDRENNTNLTEELILKTHESDLLEGLDVGFTLAHARADLRNPKYAKAFRDSVMKLKEYFISARNKYDKKVEVYELMPHEGKDWDIIYKAGKLYMPPFLLDALTSFDEEFEVKNEWTFDGLYESYMNSFIRQINWASTNEDCKDCQFTGLCAERGVHSLMIASDTQKCISPIKDLQNSVFWNE